MRCNDEVCRAVCVHACRATVAVGVGGFVERQVVVYDVSYLRDVESSGSEVGGNADVGTAVAQPAQGAFAVGLLHTAVEGYARDAVAGKEGGNLLNSLALVTKYEGRGVADAAEQLQQCVALLLAGGRHGVHRECVVDFALQGFSLEV